MFFFLEKQYNYGYMNYVKRRQINHKKISTKYFMVIFLFYFITLFSLLEADNFFIGANHMSMQASSILSNETVKSSGDSYELNFGYLWDIHKSNNKMSLSNGILGHLYTYSSHYPAYIGYVQGSYYFSLADKNFLLFGLNFPYMVDTADPVVSKYNWKGDLGYEVGFAHLWNDWLISFGYKYFSGNLRYHTAYGAYTFSGWQISGLYLLP
jgi:hypothetical protein